MRVEEVQIDDNIRPYLDEIAEKLWSQPSRAAVMVGSGFSKLANENFPDWRTLGDIFFEKICSKEPNRKEERYLDVLKLASEVEAAFKRPTLDQLLSSHIPDKESQPSDRHIELLKLPWSDIFTTNYDTLLERASNSISLKKFDVVLNKQDITYSQKPRIIKLHGSFPSTRPFIVTEEDYRTYPQEFAPFVNTVQQALLENVLCLIGFSGDDPNFLKWTGWIRDNLGKTNSPQIYLIGIFNLSIHNKKLLSDRNIVLVDLSKCPGIEGRYDEAFKRFFAYLSACEQRYSIPKWPPREIVKCDPQSTEDRVAKLKELIKEWEETRISYPGWIIASKNQRNTLLNNTNSCLFYILSGDNLPVPWDLKLFFELNWRFEHFLSPIWNHIAELFAGVITKYWPFKENKPQEAAIYPLDSKHQNLDWPEIQKMWLELSLAMLRFYREEGMFEEWGKTDQTLSGLTSFFSREQKAFFHYERALYALFKLDILKLTQELHSWPEDLSIPFWEAKRAGLLAELGQLKEAEQILDRSLQEVRIKLNLNPISRDYSLASQEAYIMVLAKYIKDAGQFLYDPSQDKKTQTLSEEFQERWNTLKQYKCDPWDEIHIFAYQLEKQFFEKVEVSETPGFDIGDVTRTHRHPTGWDKDTLDAYTFLRYFETSGFPFKISYSSLGKKSAEGAIQRIYKASSYWAKATLNRLGDADVTDKIFNRQFLVKYNVDHVDKLIDEYLDALKKIAPHIAHENWHRANHFGMSFAQVVPEILSRLCCKCSMDKKHKLLDFVCYKYSLEYRNHYKSIKNFLPRLLASLNKEEQYKLIPKLLEIPFPGKIGEINLRLYNFPNPFPLVPELKKEDISHLDKVIINKEHIEQLFRLSSSNIETERKWGVGSLIQLYLLDLLTDQSAVKLGKILWSKLDASDFPANTNYHRFTCLKLPRPKNIDPIELIKNYIKKTDFPVQAHEKTIPAALQRGSITITGGDIPVCDEIIGANRVVEWSKEEIIDLFTRLIAWWDADKTYLNEDKKPSFFHSIPEEFRKRFTKLINVLVYVVFPNIKQDSAAEIKNEVIRFIHELDDYNIPSARIQSAALDFLQVDEEKLLTRLQYLIGSKIEYEVVRGLNALPLLLKNASHLKSIPASRFLSILSQMLRWRHPVSLVGGLNMAAIIIKEFPEKIDEEFKGSCLFSLNALASESLIEQKDTEHKVAEKLMLRQAAARLAYQLYILYKNRNEKIYDEILKWQKICSSSEEFAEIRVEWIAEYG